MTYLLSRVRREIEQRFQTVDVKCKHVLVIDFDNGDLVVNSKVTTKSSISLVEAKDGLAELFHHDDSSQDVIVLNLQISWLDYRQILAECRRILKPEGALYFSAFGPDTLSEVAYIWHQVDTLPHVHPFVDIHLIGDALVKNGFVKSILDADWLTIEYPHVELLLKDLKKEGFTNIIQGRRKTLTGKERFNSFKEILWEKCNYEGKLLITFELIFGFARVPCKVDAMTVTLPGITPS